MKFLVTRPEHDVTTKYLSHWASVVIDIAQKKGFEVIDLYRQKAKRTELEGRIMKVSPVFIFLNGHGNDNCVTGHNNEELVITDDNHTILNGTITYALSCNSSKGLGKRVAEDSTATYIGYDDEFIFLIGKDFISKPIEDPQARPFMESSNQLVVSLLKGHSTSDARQRAKDKYIENYHRLSSSSSDSNSLQAAQFLWWNMRNLKCLGCQNSKIL